MTSAYPGRGDAGPAPRPGSESGGETQRRLQWLMAGRLVVATVLLGGTLLLSFDRSVEAGSFTPQFLQLLIAATYAASLGFAIWLPRARDLRVVAVTQLSWDLLVTTGLVAVSGGAASGFTFLYGVVVLMAAIILGGRAVAATATAGLVLYTVAGVGLANGWLPAPPDQLASHYRLPYGELGSSLLMNVVGLGLVTLLASNLSSRLRKTGGQLRRAEESAASLLRLNDDIVRSIASGLLTADLEGRVRTTNPAAAEMFRTPTVEIVGRSVRELLPVTGDPPAMDPEASAPIATREDGLATRPDGSTFPVGYAQTPLVEADGKVIGTLITFQDLTEIRELRRTAERAERLAVLGRLAAGLAHEIRNPLSSISGSVEIVRDVPALGGEDRQLLGIVLTEVGRLNDLVTTMLQVGRPSAPHLAATALGELSAEVVEMARRGPAAGAGVCIELSRPSTPVVAWADASQLRQVVWNLVKNAIQASDRDGVIDVSVQSRPDGWACLEVRDHGAGVDETELEKLFDMFYSGRPQGVGLGLALVKQIVEAHRGSVEVESRKGHGTLFRVLLPETGDRRE